MDTVRRLGALLLILAAIGVWFGMKPAAPEGSASGYRGAVENALAADELNNKSTQGAPQQTVVNGWTAKDLLTIIAREEADKPADERPAALLALAVIGLGLVLATTKRPSPSHPAFTPAPQSTEATPAGV